MKLKVIDELVDDMDGVVFSHTLECPTQILFLFSILCVGTKLKDFVATLSSPDIQSEVAKVRNGVEEYAKQFPTIGFEKETMKYKN